MSILKAGLHFLCVFAACIPLQAREKLAATQVGSRIDVTIGGKFFTSFRVLVFSGTVEAAGVAEIFKEFSASNPQACEWSDPTL